jgi:hypothetical protein
LISENGIEELGLLKIIKNNTAKVPKISQSVRFAIVSVSVSH